MDGFYRAAITLQHLQQVALSVPALFVAAWRHTAHADHKDELPSHLCSTIPPPARGTTASLPAQHPRAGTAPRSREPAPFLSPLGSSPGRLLPALAFLISVASAMLALLPAFISFRGMCLFSSQICFSCKENEHCLQLGLSIRRLKLGGRQAYSKRQLSRSCGLHMQVQRHWFTVQMNLTHN